MMDFKHLKTVADLKRFVDGSRQFILKATTIEDRYEVIQEVVERFNYLALSKREKHIVLRFLKTITGYKHTQLAHLIERAIQGELIRKPYVRLNSYHRYSGFDIRLLERTDELHFRLSAAATHEIMRREYERFHHQEFKNIARVSCSHINNLRHTDAYKAKYLHHTQARIVAIGETKQPEPNGYPGSIRVDTVSQRDIYIINSIDEITQWEIVIAVPSISEAYLGMALRILLDQYPFMIFNFHSDRGGEFINHVVAQLLHKLLIHQTKSRSRHCNDQALIEGKNGSIIRKNFGYYHVNQELVGKYNEFYDQWFNPYLNYHRPCGYVTEIKRDHKGREEKIYGQYTTPYEKLKEVSHQQKQTFLKPGISFKDLDTIAYQMSDNDFAQHMRKVQYQLFDITNLLSSRL